jgi:hypothetical protein
MKRPAIFLVAVLAACDVSDPVRFSPDGGAGGCPELLDGERAPLVDNTCAHTRCEVRAIENGCAIALALDTCEISEVRAEVTSEGALQFMESSAGVCRPTTEAEGAYFSTVCERMNGSCRIDVYPSTRGDFAETMSLNILNVPFIPLNGADDEPLGPSHVGTRGYFSGALQLDDTIVVSSYDGRFDGVDCTSDQPTRTFFVTARELLIRSSIVTPPCLTRITYDPSTAGFIGVFGGAAREVARFDAVGNIVLRQALTATATPPIFPSSLLVDRERSLLYVAWASSEGEQERAKLTIHDLTTLEQVAATPVLPTQFLFLAFSRQNDLAVTSWEERRLEFYNPIDASLRSNFFLRTLRAISDHPGYLALHKPSGLMVLGTIGERAGILSLDPDSQNPIAATAIDYEGAGAPWAMLEDPRNETLMLVGVTQSAPTYRARITRYDPVAGRFVPGSVELGRGIVSELLRVPESADVIAVLPWSAQLVRVRVNP